MDNVGERILTLKSPSEMRSQEVIHQSFFNGFTEKGPVGDRGAGGLYTQPSNNTGRLLSKTVMKTAPVVSEFK